MVRHASRSITLGGAVFTAWYAQADRMREGGGQERESFWFAKVSADAVVLVVSVAWPRRWVLHQAVHDVD